MTGYQTTKLTFLAMNSFDWFRFRICLGVFMNTVSNRLFKYYTEKRNIYKRKLN